MMRALVLLYAIVAHAAAFAHPTSVGIAVQRRAATAAMREPDSRSAAREQLLPDIQKAVDAVSRFIARADASRQRKAAAPTADDIERYCSEMERRIGLLRAEAEILKDAQSEGDQKVKWTDIDGNFSLSFISL